MVLVINNGEMVVGWRRQPKKTQTIVKKINKKRYINLKSRLPKKKVKKGG
jgi:hypothetical protein